MSDSTHYRDIHPVVISWRLTIVRWGGEPLFFVGEGCISVRLHASPGGVLSVPGPEDLVPSFPRSGGSVVVVSLPFRGVSCSVPSFSFSRFLIERSLESGPCRLRSL